MVFLGAAKVVDRFGGLVVSAVRVTAVAHNRGIKRLQALSYRTINDAFFAQ